MLAAMPRMRASSGSKPPNSSRIALVGSGTGGLGGNGLGAAGTAAASTRLLHALATAAHWASSFFTWPTSLEVSFRPEVGLRASKDMY